MMKKYSAENPDLDRMCTERLAGLTFDDVDLPCIPYLVNWCEQKGIQAFLETYVRLHIITRLALRLK
jgi:hypothetical protein